MSYSPSHPQSDNKSVYVWKSNSLILRFINNESFFFHFNSSELRFCRVPLLWPKLCLFISFWLLTISLSANSLSNAGIWNIFFLGLCCRMLRSLFIHFISFYSGIKPSPVSCRRHKLLVIFLLWIGFQIGQNVIQLSHFGNKSTCVRRDILLISFASVDDIFSTYYLVAM